MASGTWTCVPPSPPSPPSLSPYTSLGSQYSNDVYLGNVYFRSVDLASEQAVES